MELVLLAKKITKIQRGDEIDFLDYLVILRKWLDKNYDIAKQLYDIGSFNSHKFSKRTEKLREDILNKPKHKKEGHE